MINKEKKQRLLISLSFTIFSILFFCVVLFIRKVPTDIQAHVYILQKNIEHGGFMVNYLYYLIIYALSGFSSSTEYLFAASIIVLSISVGLKTWLSLEYISENKTRSRLVFLLTTFLMLSFNIFLPEGFILKYRYFGQFPPNVWHNSTVIFLMPWAFILFKKICNELNSQRFDNIGIILLLVFLNVSIKPSYIFCIVPSLGIIYIFNKKYHKQFKWFATIIGTSLLLIITQYIMNYILNVNNNVRESKIGIDFFDVWNHFSNNKIISLLLSFLFPILTVALYWKKILNEISVYFALISTAVGLIISFTFTEYGEFAYHGNFTWQNVINNFLLFAVLTRFLLTQNNNLKRIISISFLGLHALFGVAYLFYFLYYQSYY
jgi:hypothetical protein